MPLIAISIASGGRLQVSWAQTSTQPLVTSGPLTHSWPSAATRTMSLDVASHGYTCHSHQHGSLRLKSPRALGSDTDLVCPQWSQASSWPGAAAWTTNTNIASCGIADHGGPSRRSTLECEPFHILGLCCCPELGGSHSQGQIQGLSLCLLKLQAVANHLSSLVGQWQHVDLSPLRCHCHHISNSAFLPSIFTGQAFLPFPLLHHIFAHCSDISTPRALSSRQHFRCQFADLFKEWKYLPLTHQVIVEKDTLYNIVSLHDKYPRNTYEWMRSLIP